MTAPAFQLVTSKASPALGWKDDWEMGRQALDEWWRGKGLALHVTAPRDEPWEDCPAPPAASPEVERLDVRHRLAAEHHRLASTYFGGVAFPVFNGNIGGPGSLGLFLGAIGHIDEETVWYEPVIDDPLTAGSLVFDPENDWYRNHFEMIDAARRLARGRYLVACPDLIENLDTLAQLRGTEALLVDLVERPEWVHTRLEEINQAFFDCFDDLWPLLVDPWGGSAFHAFQLWGPGKTAKVQCDLSCAIGPAMFSEFVAPLLSSQCAWLDYPMYHLDGTQAIKHLDTLLSIESIRAIEWTPQAGLPRGGDPRWFDLYRRIRSGGKSVQAVEVPPEEVLPLIDAVGPEGLFIITETETEAQARRLLARCGWKGV